MIFLFEENPFKIGELKIPRSRCDEIAKDLLKKICESYYMGRTNTDDEYIYFEIYDKYGLNKYSSPVNLDCFKDCKEDFYHDS